MEPSAAEPRSRSSLSSPNPSSPRAAPGPLFWGVRIKKFAPKTHGFGDRVLASAAPVAGQKLMSSSENQSEHSPPGISKAKLAAPYGNAEQHADTVSGQRNVSQEFMWPDMFAAF